MTKLKEYSLEIYRADKRIKRDERYGRNKAGQRFIEVLDFAPSTRDYIDTVVAAKRKQGFIVEVFETFVVQKIYFGIIETDADTGAYTGFIPIGPYGTASWQQGEYSFLIANSQVIKQLPFLTSFVPNFNVSSTNAGDEAFNTFTDIVIPPLLEYVLTYRLPNYTAVENTRLACFIEGTAGILAPQTTF